MYHLINDYEEIICWPKKKSDKEKIIKWLSTKFSKNKKYSEKEVNIILDKYHKFNDIPLLRRELISKKYLRRKRDGSIYWRE